MGTGLGSALTRVGENVKALNVSVHGAGRDFAAVVFANPPTDVVAVLVWRA